MRRVRGARCWLAGCAALGLAACSGDADQTASVETAAPTVSEEAPTSELTTPTSMSELDPQTYEMPAPDPSVVEATQAFLAGDGALLLTFRTAIAPLTASSDGGAATTDGSMLELCTSVATSLDVVPPDDLLVAARGVPDAVLAELFVAERRLASDALVACGDDQAVARDAALRSLMDTDILVGRRLTELGL